MTTTLPSGTPRFHVDGWDPSYGSAMEDTGEVTSLTESTARVDPGVETAPEKWAPVPVPGTAWEPDAVVFVDGVRRIEARVWMPDRPARSVPRRRGLVCGRRGVLLPATVERIYWSPTSGRGLFTTDTQAATWPPAPATFRTHHVAADEAESPAVTLSAALQRELLTLELLTAVAARTAVGDHGIHRRGPAGDRRAVAGPRPSAAGVGVHQDAQGDLPAAGAQRGRCRVWPPANAPRCS